MIINE